MNACPTPLVHKILQIKLTLVLLGKKCVGGNGHEKTWKKKHSKVLGICYN
jgi:hypothetical protein